MIMRRFVRIHLALLVFGLSVASLWIYLTGGSDYMAALVHVRPVSIVLMCLITIACLLIRFIRWQFLLRRAGVRLPTRSSLSMFLASLWGIATPAYAGELIRCVLIRRRYGIALRITTSVWILDRLLDVTALGTIGLLAADTFGMRELMAFLIAAAALCGWAGSRLARSLRVSSDVLTSLMKPSTLFQALALSLLAWLPAALAIAIAAWGLGISLPVAAGLRIFSVATLLGAVTLVPAGIGTTGSLAILQLRSLGLTLPDSLVVVTLLRLTTMGLALGVGAGFLLREFRDLKRIADTPPFGHFDAIAAQYQAQFPPHIWEHLLDRKIRLLTAALPDFPSAAGIGLDLGCGFGAHSLIMGKLGYRVVGVDSAPALLKQAEGSGVSAVAGRAHALPFRDTSFDFVYAVGVVHHLPGWHSQGQALAEVARVLKPGGRFVVLETNPRNPLFRFYMGYVFPIIRQIDEGIEWWVEPHRWQGIDGMQLLALQYFTFLPDFLPRRLMRLFLRIERRLERSPLRVFSVHYIVALQKNPM